MIKYTQLTDPASEPITVAEVKAQLRLSTSADDTLITSTIIPGVRDFAERHTMTAIPQRTFTAVYDNIHRKGVANVGWFDGTREGSITETMVLRKLEIPLPPLVSVEAVRTYNRAGTSSVFSSSSYYLDTYAEPGALVLKDGYTWPVDLRDVNAVEIDFTAGYDTVPPMLKIAMLQIAAHWYENRELFEIGTILARVPISAMAILDRFKLRRL